MGVEVNASLIGQNLGPYRIVEQIGQGGMATVYKAYEPALDRYVAIKVLPQYFAHDADFSARFDREAKAVARLNHPNILPIYSFGQEGGLSYIAMRYVGQGTLKDRLGQPLDLETTLDILRQIGQALDYAHRQGIIHRDVKPSNVLMAEGHSQAPGGGNWILLADFGLARMVESSSQLTQSGVGVGTPAYMSPEQGQGAQVDARSDLYSLGVVLYEMLTGRVPYEAETPMAVVLKHITAPLPMPRSLNPALPDAAERVILKAMAKNPEDRFQTAQEMVEALDRALEQAMEEAAALSWLPEEEPEVEPAPPLETEPPAEALPAEALPAEALPAEALPVQAPPVEMPVVETPAQTVPVEEQPARVPFTKRLPLWAWGAVAMFVVLVVLGGALAATGRWPRPAGHEQATPPGTSTSISRVTSTPRLPTPTSTSISRATSTPRPPTPTPEPAPPARPERSVYVESCAGLVPWQICIRDEESGEVIQVTHDLDFGEPGRTTWSPDGRQIVFNAGTGPNADGHYDHDLYVINADGSGLHRITEGEATDVDPSWSPDGEWIAFHRDCGLWLVHPDGADAHELLGASDALCVGGTSWSPDGQRIAFVNWHSENDLHEIWLIGRDGSEPHMVHAFERAVMWVVVVWSPDGSQLACMYGAEEWSEGFVLDPEGGEPHPIPRDELPWTWYPNHWPQWSGGGLPSTSGPAPEDPWGQVVVLPRGAIRIGLVADFSGPLHELGPMFENAVRMAVEEQGEIAGFPISMVIADGGCSDEISVEAAQAMIDDPSIAGVVGHTCSNSCRLALPVYEDAHLVTISPSCTDPGLSAPGYAVFNRVAMRNDQGGDDRNREMVATDPYRGFAARYEERYGQPLDSQELGFYAAYAHDAAAVLLSTIARVAVVDDAGVLIIGRQSLAESVRNIPAYEGVTGVIRFDERGDRRP